MSILTSTVKALDGLHVRAYSYSRTDGDQGTTERVTVHMASCADYKAACDALGGSKVTHVVTSTGTKYSALGHDDVLIQHTCMPHLQCYRKAS